jgi:hypothetical protein
MVPWTKPGTPAWLCMNMHPGQRRACGRNVHAIGCVSVEHSSSELYGCIAGMLDDLNTFSKGALAATWEHSCRPLAGSCMEGAMQVAWNGIRVQRLATISTLPQPRPSTQIHEPLSGVHEAVTEWLGLHAQVAQSGRACFLFFFLESRAAMFCVPRRRGVSKARHWTPPCMPCPSQPLS